MTEKIDRELLIDLVRNEPRLWDHYRDIKSQLWESIGVELSVKGEQARKAWENLRDTFRRKCKVHNETKSGLEIVRVKWPYFNSMLFLKGIMTSRDSSGNLPILEEEYEPSPCERSPVTPDEESVNDAELETNRCSTEPEASASISNTQANETKCHLKRLNDNDLEIDELKKRKIDQFQYELSRKTLKYQNDDDYAFFMSLLPTVKTFSQLEKMKLRMKILKNVTEALEQHNFTTSYPTGSLQSSPSPSPEACDNSL